MRKSTNHLHIPLPKGVLRNKTRRMLDTFRNVKPLLLPYGLLRISVFKAWVAVRPVILSNMQKAQESHQCDSVQSVSKKTHSEGMTEKSLGWKRKPKCLQESAEKFWKWSYFFRVQICSVGESCFANPWKKTQRDRAKRLKTIISFMCQNSGWKSKWFISGKKCGS